MEETFINYVNTFDTKDENIILKLNHTLRVRDLCVLLAEKENLNYDDVKLAEIIGLLHDYGRFEQWTKYRTFRDNESIDHAEYAIEKLFYEGEITKYWNIIKGYDEIFDAIKYHNKLSLPKTLSHHNETLCKIIRDADKLDVFNCYITGESKFTETGEDFTKELINSFNEEKPIDQNYRRSKDDGILYILGFIYDLNFDYSFEYLKQNKIIDKLYKKIKDKKRFKPYFDKIKTYIDKKQEKEDVKC